MFMSLSLLLLVGVACTLEQLWFQVRFHGSFEGSFQRSFDSFDSFRQLTQEGWARL